MASDPADRVDHLADAEPWLELLDATVQPDRACCRAVIERQRPVTDGLHSTSDPDEPVLQPVEGAEGGRQDLRCGRVAGRGPCPRIVVVAVVVVLAVLVILEGEEPAQPDVLARAWRDREALVAR